MSNMPFIGKSYKVIFGVYSGFQGECVSYDLESDLPIILQDKNYNIRAVRVNEVMVIDNDSRADISRLQKQ